MTATKWPFLCLVLQLILNCGYVDAQDGMGFIGTAVEAFSPCDSRVLAMSREIGGPPATENYWEGRVSLDDWPKLSEVRLSLTVDNPAKIELDPNDGRVLVNNHTFHMSFFKHPPEISMVQFTVRGRPFGNFPNVQSLELNGLEICKDPAKWKPAILGNMNDGDINDDQDKGPSPGGTASLGKCGRRQIHHESLITNGYDTRQGDFPWHVAIYHRVRRDAAYKCGGSLINENTIITAAHCIYDESGRVIIPERMIVHLGKYKLYSVDENTKEFPVFEIIRHPEYNVSTLANDIAILKLANNVQFTSYIQPVCLWDRTKTSVRHVENKLGTVMGWGFTELDEASDVLREAKMPVVQFSQCLQSNRDFFGFFLSDRNFCAGFRNGTSVCNGDSGGGMVFEEDGTWQLRGVVSISMKREDKDLCNTSHYVIFTDVAQYLPWIENETSASRRS